MNDANQLNSLCACHPGRRGFLTSMAAGAAALAAPATFAATPKPAKGAKRRRIDVHHHLLPKSYVDAIVSRRAGEPPRPWSPAQSLEDMDKNDIATSVLSAIQPGVWFGDVELGRKLSRELNEYAAKLGADHPGRYGSFAAIPLPDTEGSLREIEYALDTLKADGIGLMTSYGDKWLGDRAFWPVMEELNRRKAVVYTHPLAPDCCRSLAYDMPASSIEYATDTTRTVGSLLFSGTVAKFPDIRFIVSHSGGTTPFLTGRFERLEAGMKNAKERLPNGVMHELKKLYYDTAQGNTPMQLAALLKLVTPAQMLFGSDFPFRPGEEVVAGLAAQRFHPRDLQSIERGNALRLMPRLPA